MKNQLKKKNKNHKNFEKYKTAAERTRAHIAFCRKNNCSECPARADNADCRFAWLDLEAEPKAEKPLSCPFCGSDVFVGPTADTNGNRSLQMKCKDDCNCGYCGPMRLTKYEAVDAHNRVARAVIDAKKGGGEK